MKIAINYLLASRSLALTGLILFGALISGCHSYGPIGSPNFDPAYSRTLEINERLLFTTPVGLVTGTYMEGEEDESFPAFTGMLLLTDQRVLFAQWNGKQQRYEPTIWTGYPYIAQVKMHNNVLLQYIAVAATDGSKMTYMLDKSSVESAYAILLEHVQKSHKAPVPTGPSL